MLPNLSLKTYKINKLNPVFSYKTLWTSFNYTLKSLFNKDLYLTNFINYVIFYKHKLTHAVMS